MGKHFVLTISREFGAEGHEIGKVLSERLGVKLYDKELLARAAAKSGVDVNSVTKTWNGVLWILILETDALILHRRISFFIRKHRS